MTKTKAELEKEIADSRHEIDALKCELEKVNRIDKKNECAAELYEMYQSFITVGFTQKQAWELMKTIVKSTAANTNGFIF